jgi:hypothetical protein
MPSEYDFLLPYSRRMRRLGAMAMGVGAFLAGAVCMAAIIALPLRPYGGSESSGTVAATQDEQKPAAPAVTAANAVPAAKLEEKPAAPRPDASPQVAASPASDPRETTGLGSSTAKPREAPASTTPAPPPATTTAKAADSVAAPASAQTSSSSRKPAKQKAALPAREPTASPAAAPRSTEDAAATTNASEPAASDSKPKATERRKSRSTYASRRQQQRRYAQPSDDTPSSRNADGDRYSAWRERDYATQWRERAYAGSAFADDPRPSRRVIIIRRPSWFGGDDD